MRWLKERMTQSPTNEEIRERYHGFPVDIPYNEFLRRDRDVRGDIITKNDIIRTDAYNRTMERVSRDPKAPATYVLQMRRADSGYLIAEGVEDVVRQIARVRITQPMLDFATEYYKHVKGVNFFDSKLWQEIIDKYDGHLPFTIDCVPDGTAVLSSDPILRISGPNELVARFEPQLHWLFYESLVATNAHRIAQTVGADRFIEVGLRGARNDMEHLKALKAAYIGGGIHLTSNDEAPAYIDQYSLVGTIGHRNIQEFIDDEEAFRNDIDKLDNVTLLVDLYSSYEGIDLALQLKQEYRNTPKKIWIRLDSGDVSAQTLYTLAQQRKLGFLDPAKDKIVVEGIEHLEEMIEIDRRVREAEFDPEQFVLYGAGGLLIADHTTRSDASTGFKLAQHAGRSTMKFSDSPGKESIPGQPGLYQIHGTRVIAQVGELPEENSLMVRVYDKGTLYLDDDIDKARALADKSYVQLVATGQKSSIKSPATEQMVATIKAGKVRRDAVKYTNR